MNVLSLLIYDLLIKYFKCRIYRICYSTCPFVFYYFIFYMHKSLQKCWKIFDIFTYCPPYCNILGFYYNQIRLASRYCNSEKFFSNYIHPGFYFIHSFAKSDVKVYCIYRLKFIFDGLRFIIIHRKRGFINQYVQLVEAICVINCF